MSNKNNDFQKFYDDIYESQVLSDELYVRATRWKAENLFSLVPNDLFFDKILEVGCGAGILLKEVHRITGCKNLYGVDISEVAIKKAAAILPFGQFHVKSIADLDYPANFFDLLILCDILEHIPDVEKIMPAITRCAKYILLKIPIENAIASRIMYKIRKITQNLETHPSGHLYTWNKQQALQLIRSADNVKILRSKFEPFPYELSTHKTLIKAVFLKGIQCIDKLLASQYLSEKTIGGSLFILCRNIS